MSREPAVCRAFLFVLLFPALALVVCIGRLTATPGEALPLPAASPSFWRYASSNITITGDGQLLVAVNPDSNSITLVDTGLAVATAEIPVGNAPNSVALSFDDGVAYVANQNSNTLSVVDIAAQTVITNVAVGDRPAGVAVSPDGRFLALSELGDDKVRTLDASSLATLRVVHVDDRPYGLAFTPDGHTLLVTHLLQGEVTLLPVQPYSNYLPVAFAEAPASTLAGDSGALQKTAPSPRPTISTWPNVAPAPAVAIDAAGSRAYLPQTVANSLGLNTHFDTTVFPKVSVVNLEAQRHESAEQISIPEIDRPVGLPWAVALADAGRELWVVNAASNDVSVIDIGNPQQPMGKAHILVGDNPRGIVFSPDGATAYVNNTLAGTVSVIDSASYTVTEVITITNLPLPPVLLEGKRLFHNSARPQLALANWISCNTCHVEGEHDGRTWLLQFPGEVPPGASAVITRNTTSLRGMIETYPLRWSAEWDESADSEFSIRFEQFGAGLIPGNMHPTLGTPNQGRSNLLDALAAYIDSLQFPVHGDTLTPLELWGRDIFESAATGCAACHPAPLYTDLQVHNVGTADAFGEWFGPLIDTPTLRFLYDSAPYLHDGSASTLLELLTTANPADQHGVTSSLNAMELEALVAFLHALPYGELE